MRVMVLVHATPQSEAEQFDNPEVLAEFEAMGRFNEELVKAGIMLAGEGLAPSSQGKRVAFGPSGTPSVIDGPFTEAKELVGGFWVWQVSSMDEAVEWSKRAPFRDNVIELRRVYEESDFEGKVPSEIIEAEAKLRDQVEKQQQ
jgi:hypothetical protein